MKKEITCFVVFILCIGKLFAQKITQDTVITTKTLQEVEIHGSTNNKSNQAFNFYKNSKVAGTEDILSRIEGVNLIKRGAFGMEPILRTYQGGQINTMINGMKMYGACTDKMDPVSSYIEPGNLSKLSLQHGAGMNMLGSTIGGTINFELGEPIINCHNKFSSQLYSQFSTVNNATNNGYLVNVSGKKWAARASGAYRKAANYMAGGNKIVNHSQYEKFNTHVGLNYQLNQKNYVIADAIIDQGMNIGYPALPMDVSLARAFITSLTHRKKHFRGVFESKIYYNKVSHQMDDTKRAETIIHMDMPGWSETMGFFTRLERFTKHSKLELRIDGHDAYTRADMIMYPTGQKEMFMQTLPGNHLKNIGTALSIEKKLSSKFQVSANTRIDYFSQNVIDTLGILQWTGFGFDLNQKKQNVLPNASLQWRILGKKVTQNITFAYGNRLPTSNERIGFYLFNRADAYDYIGNYNLKPEEAWQAEWKIINKRKEAEYTLNLFYHHITQYIYGFILPSYSPMTIGGRGVKTYDNIAFANLLGAEASGKVRFSDLLSYQGNLRYTYATLSNKLPMQQVPPLKIINSIRYATDKIQIQFDHQLAAAQNRINPDFGEVSTQGWQTFALRLSYTFTLKNSLIQAHSSIENMLDTYYREHLDWNNIPQAGRNFVLGVNVIIP